MRDPDRSREREVIERQVRHMTRLVDDLLDVSRIAGGKIELNRENIELTPIVDDAIELVRPLIETRRHTLVVHVDAGLAVDGDRARLVQVLSNLLNNAAKYTPPGGAIELAAKREGDEVVLRVSDNGAGISPDLLPSIFELFVQGERSIERARGGLGLGLAIVHSLVGLHGGDVSASSEGEGKGATFTVRLPALTVATAPEPAREHLPASVAPRRILIVDDNEDAAELMGEALTRAGHSVRIAHDGLNALELAAEFDPDCVMLDIGLPLLDGYEVARRLRDRDERRRTLVAITGYGQADDVRRALAAGFDRHLVKPLSFQVALDIIANSPGAADS